MKNSTTFHSTMTSKKSSAKGSRSASTPSDARSATCSPRPCAVCTASRETSTPQAFQPRARASSMNSPVPHPMSSRRDRPACRTPSRKSRNRRCRRESIRRLAAGSTYTSSKYSRTASVVRGGSRKTSRHPRQRTSARRSSRASGRPPARPQTGHGVTGVASPRRVRRRAPGAARRRRRRRSRARDAAPPRTA